MHKCQICNGARECILLKRLETIPSAKHAFPKRLAPLLFQPEKNEFLASTFSSTSITTIKPQTPSSRSTSLLIITKICSNNEVRLSKQVATCNMCPLPVGGEILHLMGKAAGFGAQPPLCRSGDSIPENRKGESVESALGDST